MSEKKLTITLKGEILEKLKKLREKTGIPISQMVTLIIKGYTIKEISTNIDLLKELRENIK